MSIGYLANSRTQLLFLERIKEEDEMEWGRAVERGLNRHLPKLNTTFKMENLRKKNSVSI